MEAVAHALQPPGVLDDDTRARRVFRWGTRIQRFTTFAIVDAVVLVALLWSGFNVGGLVEVLIAPFALLAVLSVPWSAAMAVLATLLLLRWRDVPADATYPWYQARQWSLFYVLAMVGVSLLIYLGVVRL